MKTSKAESLARLAEETVCWYCANEGSLAVGVTVTDAAIRNLMRYRDEDYETIEGAVLAAVESHSDWCVGH